MSAPERAVPRGSTGMKPKVFRSNGARLVAWAWMAFAGLNLVDVAVRGHDRAGLMAAAVLLLGCGLAYGFGLRPRIVADDAGVRLHNPLRDVRVPWPALRQVEAAETLHLHCTWTSGEGAPGEEGQRFKAWSFQTSPRARARAERRARREVPDALAQHLNGRSPALFVAEQLTELAATRGGLAAPDDDRRDGARPSVTWSVPAVAALALPVALLIVLILVSARG
ncbi:MAG: hypothetical protein JWO67_5828 [Streptosporangiaceae bacterium]|nr:hypothetical protein [Streptosporangiaceae bacterium]